MPATSALDKQHSIDGATYLEQHLAHTYMQHTAADNKKIFGSVPKCLKQAAGPGQNLIHYVNI